MRDDFAQLNIQVLHQNSTLSDPMGEAFDYAKKFKSLDLNAVIKDLHALMRYVPALCHAMRMNSGS